MIATPTAASSTYRFLSVAFAAVPRTAFARRCEATLWRQSRQILLALDALDRRKPQERTRFCVDDVDLRIR
jgi:hypothetical protein